AERQRDHRSIRARRARLRDAIRFLFSHGWPAHSVAGSSGLERFMSFPQYRYLAPEQLEATPHDFEKAARLLRTRTGIVLGDHKREMAARALSTRARKLSVASIAEYLTFLEHHPKDDEWHEFINAFTINHTAFFREQHHFKMLAEFVRTRKAPVSV